MCEVAPGKFASGGSIFTCDVRLSFKGTLMARMDDEGNWEIGIYLQPFLGWFLLKLPRCRF